MIPKIYISIKRGIESRKTETAGYTSCLDIGFITSSPGQNRCKIAFANLVIHESRVSARTFVISSTERNSFVLAIIRVFNRRSGLADKFLSFTG